jgi:hypothetical protein
MAFRSISVERTRPSPLHLLHSSCGYSRRAAFSNFRSDGGFSPAAARSFALNSSRSATVMCRSTRPASHHSHSREGPTCRTWRVASNQALYCRLSELPRFERCVRWSRAATPGSPDSLTAARIVHFFEPRALPLRPCAGHEVDPATCRMPAPRSR